MEYKGLPVYFIDLDDDSIFNNISVVDVPAIRRDFIQLSAQEEFKFKVNEEKRTISGPVLIPNQPIYRKNDEGKEFYIQFDEDVIKSLAIKFFKDHRETEGNVMHSVSVNGITFYESYLINKERGIAPKEFEDLPDGSWICSARVDNDRVWELIKDGTLRGFSVDIATPVRSKMREIDTIEELEEYLNNYK